MTKYDEFMVLIRAAKMLDIMVSRAWEEYMETTVEKLLEKAAMYEWLATEREFLQEEIRKLS